MIYSKFKILIPIIRRNIYDINFLWLIGLIFKLRFGLIFQYTQLQLRSWCTKYICILNTIFTRHVHKKFTFRKVSIICGWFLIFQQVNVVFVYFHDFWLLQPHIFSEIPTTCCSEIQIVDNQFILHPKSITGHVGLVSHFCG